MTGTAVVSNCRNSSSLTSTSGCSSEGAAEATLTFGIPVNGTLLLLIDSIPAPLLPPKRHCRRAAESSIDNSSPPLPCAEELGLPSSACNQASYIALDKL
ncbi:hypothetical protein Ccrd_010973 [Cynara cardunculus var. scolymus]|uniref:Uncharacterized protein n=1 Tax=Cynara cardunculus var. scolymus TaxID=59895 RepID=A0A103YK45_CYNCS|nr:hypothetical protein Ccrd_010973 [Cynara cardunculus var. scolymus]